jgi:hypothetical protein
MILSAIVAEKNMNRTRELLKPVVLLHAAVRVADIGPSLGLLIAAVLRFAKASLMIRLKVLIVL